MNHSIVDAHAHCGIQDRFPPQAFEDYAFYAKGTGISEVVMFAPVAEMAMLWTAVDTSILGLVALELTRARFVTVMSPAPVIVPALCRRSVAAFAAPGR